jgi:hypothetical protein
MTATAPLPPFQRVRRIRTMFAAFLLSVSGVATVATMLHESWILIGVVYLVLTPGMCVGWRLSMRVACPRCGQRLLRPVKGTSFERIGAFMVPPSRRCRRCDVRLDGSVDYAQVTVPPPPAGAPSSA